MDEGVLVRTEFDPASDRSVSLAVVEALSLVVGDRTDLPPLGERIDTDSLDALFSSYFGSPPAPEVQLTFPYEEWQVSVSGSGKIAVSTRPDSEIPTG